MSENGIRYRVVFAPKRERSDGVAAVHVYVFADDTEGAIEIARRLGFDEAWSVHRAMPDKEKFGPNSEHR